MCSHARSGLTAGPKAPAMSAKLHTDTKHARSHPILSRPTLPATKTPPTVFHRGGGDMQEEGGHHEAHEAHLQAKRAKHAQRAQHCTRAGRAATAPAVVINEQQWCTRASGARRSNLCRCSAVAMVHAVHAVGEQIVSQRVPCLLRMRGPSSWPIGAPPPALPQQAPHLDGAHDDEQLGALGQQVGAGKQQLEERPVAGAVPAPWCAVRHDVQRVRACSSSALWGPQGTAPSCTIEAVCGEGQAPAPSRLLAPPTSHPTPDMRHPPHPTPAAPPSSPFFPGPPLTSSPFFPGPPPPHLV